MKKYAGLALGLAALLTPTSARADFSETRCVGTQISGTLTCVAAKFVLNGGNLQVYLFNGASAASSAIMSSLQGFGVYNLTSYGGTWGLSSVAWQNFVGTPGVASGDVTSDWAFITSIPGIPGVTFKAGADASGNGGLVTCAGPSGGSGTNYKTCDGAGGANTAPTFTGNQDWMLFTFSHTGGTALDEAALTSLEWGWKAQRIGTGSISLECRSDVTSSTAAKYCGALEGNDPPGGGEGDDDVVPEPATMSLMAMGLAGMAASRRRRKK